MSNRWILLTSLLVVVVAFFTAAMDASAQLAVTDIGVSPLTNERFQCIRFTNAAQNKVSIIKLSTGREKQISRNAAKRRLKGQDIKVSRQLKNTKQSLAAARKQLRKFFKKPPSKQNVAKLLKLNQRIEKLELRSSTLTGQKGAIKELRNAVIACGKQEIGIGASLRVVSGTYLSPNSGTLNFWAAIQLVIDPIKAANLGLVNGSKACVSVTGNSTPIRGMGGNFSPEGTPSLQFLIQDPCYVRAPAVGSTPGECYAPASGLGTFFHGNSGVQAPGTCPLSFSFECSLEDSISELNSRLAQMEVLSVKVGSTCS